MGIEIEYSLGYASSGDSLFRDTGVINNLSVLRRCHAGVELFRYKLSPQCKIKVDFFILDLIWT